MSERNLRPRRTKLAHVVIQSYLILALVLIVSINLILTLVYYQRMVTHYSDLAYSYARAAADFIDGDRVEGYLTGTTTDDYYNSVQRLLVSMEQETDMEYYSVLAPRGDRVVYVWNSNMNVGITRGTEKAYEDKAKTVLETLVNENKETVLVHKHSVYGYVITGFGLIRNSRGEVVAFSAAVIPMRNLRIVLTSLLFSLGLYILLVIAFSSVMNYRRMRKKMIRPLHALTHAANEMVDNLEAPEPLQLEIHTGSEIDDLADAFLQMNTGLRRYIAQLQSVTSEKERIAAELNIATQIQADMLPRIFPFRPDRPEFDLYATMDPAKEVGGDFYDYFMVDDDHLAIVIGDVSGKGVPAALFMVISKTLIKNYTMMGLAPNEVFDRTNSDLCEGNEAELFTTAWLGIYELSTGRLLYADAGHETALRRKTDGAIEDIHPARKNLVLAAMDGLHYRLNEAQLLPGETLLIYTDGVVEAMNTENALFGMDRLRDTFARHGTESTAELLPSIRAEVDRFVGEAPQFDDLTMLALEIRSKEEPK